MRRGPGFFLDDIIEAVESIFTFVEGYDYERFSNDDKTLSAVIRKMEIIGEATKHLPAEIVDEHPDVPWSYMAKMRDRLIHGYFGVDAEILWKAIGNRLPEILPRLREIRKGLKIMENGTPR
jgi:uncharacterized protein with HEPN domain